MKDTVTRQQAILALLLVVLAVLSTYTAVADPTGATISGASTEERANATADSRADARSTITTMLLNALQKRHRR